VDPERRVYQRLHLTKPLDGWFGDYAVQLRDISAIGALVETHEDIPLGSRALLRFYWHEHEVEIMAETVRNDVGQSGLHFVEDSEHLRNLIAESASKVLRAQQANAEGKRELNIVHGDETITAASAASGISAYLTFTFDNGVWKQRRSLLPDQPENGFTVAAGESPEQIKLLCRTYEAGDEESRRMTRLLAELSASGRHGEDDHH
jgi:citrate lyase beta subunit